MISNPQNPTTSFKRQLEIDLFEYELKEEIQQTKKRKIQPISTTLSGQTQSASAFFDSQIRKLKEEIEEYYATIASPEDVLSLRSFLNLFFNNHQQSTWTFLVSKFQLKSFLIKKTDEITRSLQENKHEAVCAIEWVMEICEDILRSLIGEDSKEYATALFRHAVFLQERRKSSLALEFYQRCKQIRMKVLSKQDRNLASTMFNCGLLLHSLKRSDDAFQEFSDAASFFEQCEGKGIDWADCKYQLVLILQTQRKFEEALAMVLEIIPIYERLRGKESKDFADAISLNASILKHQEKLEESITLYDQCKQIYIKTQGEAGKDVAKVCFQLGDIYRSQDKFWESWNAYTECELIQSSHFGKESQEVADALHNKALLLRSRKQYDESWNMFMVCKQIYESHGATVDVAHTLFGMALLRQRQESYKVSIALYQKTLQLYEQTIGRFTVDYCNCLNNIAMAFEKLGQPKDALNYYERCLDCRAFVFGKQSKQYGNILFSLAVLHKSLDHFEEAMPLFVECKTLWEELNGKHNADYVNVLFHISQMLQTDHQYDAAYKLLEECRQIEFVMIGSNHSDYATTLGCMGIVLQNLQRYEEALKMYEECRSIREKLVGKQHVTYAATLHNIASVLHITGELEKALELYHNACEIYGDTVGKGHDYALTKYNLGLLFHKLSRWNDSLQCLTECLAIQERTLGKNSHSARNTEYHLTQTLIAIVEDDILNLRFTSAVNLMIARDLPPHRILEFFNATLLSNTLPIPGDSIIAARNLIEMSKKYSTFNSESYRLLSVSLTIQKKLIAPSISTQSAFRPHPVPDWSCFISVNWERVGKFIRLARLLLSSSKSLGDRARVVFISILRALHDDSEKGRNDFSNVIAFTMNKNTLHWSSKNEFYRRVVLNTSKEKLVFYHKTLMDLYQSRFKNNHFLTTDDKTTLAEIFEHIRKLSNLL